MNGCKSHDLLGCIKCQRDHAAFSLNNRYVTCKEIILLPY